MSVAIIPYDRVINIFSIFCQQYAVAIILHGLYSNAEIVLNGGCIIAFGRTPGWPSDGWASGRVGGVPGHGAAVVRRRHRRVRCSRDRPTAGGTARRRPVTYLNVRFLRRV